MNHVLFRQMVNKIMFEREFDVQNSLKLTQHKVES
jgi:hypothetical protein